MFAHSWDEKIDITGWWMKVKTYEGADATVCSQLNSLWVFVTFNSKLLRTITGQEKIDELPS
ncbi:MAG: hypothetical protein SCALA701_21790 [Candidatus Scalindua sp.]|nr:MAG: hypothetical protein SCALA701_21790 [Candidatus Scalindua sp.]